MKGVEASLRSAVITTDAESVEQVPATGRQPGLASEGTRIESTSVVVQIIYDGVCQLWGESVAV